MNIKRSGKVVPFLLLSLIYFLIPEQSGFSLTGRIKSPDSWDDVEVQLLTVGLGSRIEARYGHTFIRVTDRKTGADHNINWGMFDFSDPYLPLNFFLGKLRYWVTDEKLGRMLPRYRNFERRSVVADTLNLTARQKEALVAKINENLKPENRYFWYQYFYKNCSTIPRDHLNEILDGKLEDRFSTEDAAIDFRHYVRENLNRPPPVSFFLDIVMNSRLETRLSKWVEMFYPSKLREYLYDFPALDDSGNPVPGMMLLSDKRVLVNLPEVGQDSWRVHPWFLLWGVLSAALMFFPLLVKGKADDISALRKNSSFSGSIFFTAPWGFFAGLLGTVMLTSWCFSEHLDLHHNGNLSIFWPVDFLYCIYPFMVLRKYLKGEKPGRGARKLFLWLSRVHFGTAVLWYLLCVTGYIQQNSVWTMSWLAPVGLLLWAAVEYTDFSFERRGNGKIHSGT